MKKNKEFILYNALNKHLSFKCLMFIYFSCKSFKQLSVQNNVNFAIGKLNFALYASYLNITDICNNIKLQNMRSHGTISCNINIL